jgi:replicative DNA helicase
MICEKYFSNYNTLPDLPVVLIELENLKGLSEHIYKETVSLAEEVYTLETNAKQDWLIQQTEDWAKERAVYNALMKSIEIVNGEAKDKTVSSAAIPDILREALAVSFDVSIGHDFFNDAQDRYDQLHKKENRLPFGIKYFDKVTKGGLARKTLTVFVAASGGGKSLAMSHFAATQLALGKNVLYISMEMSEEDLAERVEANLLDATMDDLEYMPKDVYLKKIEKLQEKVKGKLKFKEYPSNSASALNFKNLIDELRQKDNFVPDIVYVDYLNICSSYRLKAAATLQSYNYVKAVAEELRALATEYNIPVVTASQINRQGYGNSDGDLENMADSMGTVFTADLIFLLYQNEELESLGQLMVKRLKHRKGNLSVHKKFIVGINKSKMKLFDAEESAQTLAKDTSNQQNVVTSPVRVPKTDKKDLFKQFKT